MSTLNGIGTKFYGIRGPLEDGKCTATVWITFLYFPLIPLYRVEFIRQLTHPRQFIYTIIQKQKLRFSEIVKTLLTGWIAVPVMMFWPMPFAVREVGEKLGYTDHNAGGAFYTFVIVFAITWLVVFVWKWKDRDERRGLPKNYKELIKTER